MSIAELSALINQEPGIYICKFCSPRTDEEFRLGLLRSNPGNTIYEYTSNIPNQNAPSLSNAQFTTLITEITTSITKSIMKIIDEKLEKFGKRDNLVLCNLPEDESLNVQEQNDKDTSFCQQFCEDMGLPSRGIVTTHREGEKRRGCNRIVKVHFSSHYHWVRNAILKNGWRIFNNNQRFGDDSYRPYFREDLTYAEREKQRELREELKVRRSRGESNLVIRNNVIISKHNSTNN
ncbi:MAG: hypothetical protein MJA29_00070 [Candidatus Omnitrophica bacterium]|nr:hypothetical protein [Candidatus Omnitrophota bacterium]